MDGERTPVGDEWLTYAQLGTRLGVSNEAARQLVIRRKWPKRHPNDNPHGPILVLVPVNALERSSNAVRTPEHTGSEDVSIRMALGMLQERLEAAEGRATRAEEETKTERAARLEAERQVIQLEATAVVQKAALEAAENDAAKWKAWLASGLGARLKAVFWKA